MLEKLKKEVYEANMELQKHGLIRFTWGNVSGVSREHKLFVIKPSGVPYDDLTIDDMVVCDFYGNVVEGNLSPSSDTMTHAVLYQEFENISAIVHTHSQWATVWSQMKRDLPVYGTTHADTFNGAIPCARILTTEEVKQNYEKNTGKVIVETYRNRNLNECEIPGVLLAGHGPFVWGKSPKEAVYNAVVLEEISKTGYLTQLASNAIEELEQHIIEKHYFRKHGKNSYYGQNKEDIC